MNYQRLITEHPEIFRDGDDVLLHIITDPQRITSWQEKERTRLEQKGLPSSWAEIGVILDDPYIVVIRDLVEFPDGNLRGYIRLINRADLLGGQGVAILPSLRSTILLLRQYRHATRSWHLEIPRGFGEKNTPPIEQACAEIAEEVGGIINRMVDLGEMHVNTGMEGNATRLFFAQLQSADKPEKSEGIKEIIEVNLVKFEALIKEGAITDSFTIAAYTRAKLRGLI